MTQLGAVRKGLKDRLATISGLRVYSTLPSAPQSPCASVKPLSRALQTMDGGMTYQFQILVYCNPSDLAKAQVQIDEYLSDDGPNSIEAAIEADPRLGGVADSASVTGWGQYARQDEPAGGGMLVGYVDVEVFA
jgi:hypothetical protein